MGYGKQDYPLGYPIQAWPTSAQAYGCTNFNGKAYMPYAFQLKKYLRDTVWGFDHSINAEDFTYLDGTNKLKSVLDNYQGYEGEGGKTVYVTDENGNIVYENVETFMTDADGNIVYDDNGEPLMQQVYNSDGTPMIVPKIDENNSIQPEQVDEDSQSSLSRRVYKIFKSYPKLLDFQNMSIDDTQTGVNAITYDEVSRTSLDGITTIEVEPLFQIKNLSYRYDLPYYKTITSQSSSTQSIEYDYTYKFSPLHYVYDLTDFTLKNITSVPNTKKISFKFNEEAVNLMDKIGTTYFSVLYKDKTTGTEGQIDLDKSSSITSVDSIKESIYGVGTYKTKYVKNLPQILTAYGKLRLHYQDEMTFIYYLLPELVALAIATSLSFPPFTLPLGIPIIMGAYNLRKDVNAHSIGYQARQEGDFFYNIGNKWEWIYRKNMAERLDLYDKFENPSFSMSKTNKNERAVKLNPNASPVWTNRDFGANNKTKYNKYTGENEKVGLTYIERPFILNGFLESDFKARGVKRFKGAMTDYEKNTLKTYHRQLNYYDKYELEDGKTLTFTNYQYGKYKDLGNNTLQLEYSETETDSDGNSYNVTKYKEIKYKTKTSWESIGTTGQFTNKYKEWNEANKNFTHIYEGQKFSLTYMLNNNFRRTTLLVQMAYKYLDYLCDINNIGKSTRTITVQICSRLLVYYFRKKLRLRKVDMTEEDNIRIQNKFFAEFEADWLVVYNKDENKKIYFDFYTYIPDFRSHYGFGATNNNLTVKSELLSVFKKMYNKETITDDTYKGWNQFYTNNINEISSNGSLLNVVKYDMYFIEDNYFETFLREYFGAMSDTELLKIYNNEMGLAGTDAKTTIVDTSYSTNKSLDINGELKRFINNTAEDKAIGNTTSEYLMTNKIYNQQINLGITATKENKFFKSAVTITPSLSNDHITYDIRSLCLLYQLELERMLNYGGSFTEEEKEKIQEKFYTYIDTQIDSKTSVTKKDVLDLIISKCQDFIPKQDYYMTMSEFRDIVNSTNKYKAYLNQDDTSVNSLMYNLWVGYYVVPDNASEIIKELTSDGVTWKILLEKDSEINRSVNSDKMYVSPYLPMYIDVYKKLPYMCKVFLNKYAYTYDILMETIVVMKRGGRWPSTILGFATWSRIYFIAVLAIVVCIVVIIVSAGIAFPIVLAIIAAVSTIMSLVCICVAAASSNAAHQKAWKKAASIFQNIATVASIINIGYGAYSGITGEITKEMIFTIVMSSISVISTLVATYHSSKGHTKDALVWGSVATISGLIGKMSKPDAPSLTDMNAMQLFNTISPIITTIINISNQIASLIQQGKLDQIQSEIDKLEEAKKELEEALEEEEMNLVQDYSAIGVLNSTRPLSIDKILNGPDNLLLSQATIDTYDETDVDEIIEAQFEVLES